MAKTLQDFAENQRRRSYPLLFYVTSVRLWSILEAMVDDVALNRMKHPEEWQGKDIIHSITGPLLDFLQATESERAEFLLDELKVATKCSLKNGVGRFEALLQPLGLGGGIEDDVRKTLFELSQIRNAIVHRNASADKQFCNSCPWFGLKVGDPIPITHQHYSYFDSSVRWYSMELALREGTDTPERVKEGIAIRDSIAETHKRLRNRVWSAS